MKAAVVFGSASDSTVYWPVMEGLKEAGIRGELRVLSAHRVPKELEKFLKESDASVFIAGAGLSAALPGMVASQTIKPVIGVPIIGAYNGLDSFLSIHQMPPGVPVLGVGVNQAKAAANNAKKILEKKSRIVLVNGSENAAVLDAREKAKKPLDEMGISYSEESLLGEEKETVYIRFIELAELKNLRENGGLCICVPVAKPSMAEHAVEAMDSVKECLWVGLGRGENAAIAAAEIIGVHDKAVEEKILAYRKKMRETALAADKEAARKW